jgi:hypothetical protein
LKLAADVNKHDVLKVQGCVTEGRRTVPAKATRRENLADGLWAAG